MDKQSKEHTIKVKSKKKKKVNKENSKVDQASMDSFPASDPPAWYAGKDKKKK